MDPESVRKSLESNQQNDGGSMASLPHKFFEKFVMKDITFDVFEPGRVVCSMKVPPRLVNVGKFMHGGVTATLVDMVGSAAIYTSGAKSSGVSVEINVSYMDAAYLGEEIEMEARVLRVGKAVAVVSMELREKKTGKIIAQGRHTKYLAVPSKL